jgi:hypothetical protein
MGLLDDLRQQTSEQEVEDKKTNSQKANTEEIYRTQTQPKLKELYSHLLELAKHLNYLKKEIHARYIINAENQGVELLQSDYDAHIDSTTETKLVTFALKCTFPRNVEFSVNEPQKVTNNIQFFQKYNLQHQVTERKNEQHQIQGARFTVKASVTARFTFEADIEKACIKLTYVNFDQYGPISHIIKPEDINDDFIDQFDRFIIRENKDFLKENVADDVREQIRLKIEQENRERSEELKTAEKKQKDEEEKVAEESAFGFFKKKKTP